MMPSPLTRPVSTLMRATFLMGIEQTLGAVASKLRENSAGLVPIVEGQTLRGVVTEASLAAALANGHEDTDGVEVAFVAEPPVIKLYESGAEALRAFDRQRAGAMVVVDDDYRVIGILRASDLIDSPTVVQRPPLIGGMATPFGVYLTSGTASAGPQGLALVATGALLFSVLASCTLLTFYLAEWLLKQGWPVALADTLTTILQIGLFAGTFRLLPISGIHAAEHMVVHTIERGEPLIPSVVKRMPRVHPRCGTNLAVGAAIFLGIATSKTIPDETLRLLGALIVTLLFWRQIGAFVQQWVTTKPPSAKQVDMGIKSARELLEKHSRAQKTHVSFLSRLWRSGMFHVMAGSLLVSGLLAGLSALFHWDLPI